MTTHLYSGAANVGATLAERRDCTDGGGGAAAATFAQLRTADCGLLLCAAGGGSCLLVVFDMFDCVLNSFCLAFKTHKAPF